MRRRSPGAAQGHGPASGTRNWTKKHNGLTEVSRCVQERNLDWISMLTHKWSLWQYLCDCIPSGRNGHSQIAINSGSHGNERLLPGTASTRKTTGRFVLRDSVRLREREERLREGAMLWLRKRKSSHTPCIPHAKRLAKLVPTSLSAHDQNLAFPLYSQREKGCA
jgi:hypothetical protein